MQEISGTLRFESHEELEEYFDWAEGFLMTSEDVEQGLQGVPDDEVPYPLELELDLAKPTVKNLAQKNPKKTVELQKKWLEGE